MNFIHISDLGILKEDNQYPLPINLDRVLYVSAWSNNAYQRIYFRMTDGNNVTWEFKNKEDFDIYRERILSLTLSTDLSQMTKLS